MEHSVISLENIKVACKNCSLATLCLPMGLDPEDVERLDSIVRRSRPLHRGDFLFREGERFTSLYIVKSGSVKTYSPSEDGNEQVLGFHLPGELIGLDAIQSDVHGCSARVLETSVTCEIPFERLEELTSAIPSLQHQMYRLLSKEISHESEMLMLLGKRSAIPSLQHQMYRLLSKEISHESEMLMLLGKRNAEERLAAFVLSLSDRFRRRGFSPRDFYLSMSRHEIGSYLGLAVETISRLFTRFQEEGLLRVDRKHIELLDPDGLRAHLNSPSFPDRRQQFP